MASQTSNPFGELPTPNPVKLNDHYILGEIIDNIAELHESLHNAYPNIDLDILRSQLINVQNHKIQPREHLRSFLKVYRRTRSYQDAYARLDETTKRQIDAFIAGGSEQILVQDPTSQSVVGPPPAPPVKRNFKDFVKKLFHRHPHRDSANGAPNGLAPGTSKGAASRVEAEGDADAAGDAEATSRVVTAGLPSIYENVEETNVMEVYAEKEFRNWGLSVQNTPKYTFIPKTVLGLQNLVKYAKEHKLRVRCAGYRHSWSPTFSQDNQIFVSLLDLKEVTEIPDPLPIGVNYIDPGNELKRIEIAPGTAADAETALVRVGVSVTNEQFRRWAVENKRWALSVDVILVEVTFGGVNGPICHGGGRRHMTISDQVRAVEYVDANGVHRTISDPSHLRAAAGCFGLLGIVTHLTLAVNKMTYALMRPSKPDIGLAIPPLKPSDVPLALQKTYPAGQLAAAQADFEDRATNDYYSEWFWFPYQNRAWVNTWNDTTDRSGVVEYPDAFATWLQWVQNWLGGVVTSNKFFQEMPGRWQAQIMATLSMVFLPPQTPFEDVKEIKTYLPNALHFRRGIQNMRVRDMEYQIPVPYLPHQAGEAPKPDFSIIQRAWWDVINIVYAGADTPMRLTLELRIMSGSNMIMAPQAGNEWGTASIEVLTIPDAVTDGEWTGFCQEVSDKWTSYTDAEGKPLNVRAHWAKEWEMVEVRGLPAREYFKTVAYKDAIPEFKAVLADIGTLQGWDLADLKARFSNELWDDMIFS